jgi:hypothetical protein
MSLFRFAGRRATTRKDDKVTASLSYYRVFAFYPWSESARKYWIRRIFVFSSGAPRNENTTWHTLATIAFSTMKRFILIAFLHFIYHLFNQILCTWHVMHFRWHTSRFQNLYWSFLIWLLKFRKFFTFLTLCWNWMYGDEHVICLYANEIIALILNWLIVYTLFWKTKETRTICVYWAATVFLIVFMVCFVYDTLVIVKFGSYTMNAYLYILNLYKIT